MYKISTSNVRPGMLKIAAPSKYAEKASAERTQHERMQRMEQLAIRRVEQAADAAAMGRWLAGLSATVDGSDASAGGDEWRGSLSEPHQQLLAVSARLEREWDETVTELKVVREEYDLAKWKGRWSNEK